MTFGEDDDDPSITERLQRADAKQEKLDRKAKAKGKLISQIQLTSLKQQMGQEDQSQAKQAKDVRKNDVQKPGIGDFGQKSLEQKQEEETQTAQDQANNDKMIAQAQRQDEIEQQAEQEYQQDMG